MTGSVKRSKKESFFYDNIDNIKFDKLVNKCVSKCSLLNRMKNKLKRIVKKLHRGDIA